MSRAQIICIGASTTYGVGGSRGGWADLIKQNLHSSMYGTRPQGEAHEVYNLGVPGATVGEMFERTEVCLKTIRKPERRVITIFQGGANNAKAIGAPENFVSTPEEYETELRKFLKLLVALSDEIICLGLFPMNQDKVMPIVKDKEKNTLVYFPNERIKLFEDIFQKVASEMNVTFVPLFETALKADWTERLQFQDGIHPNDAGHVWICEQITPHLTELLAI